MEGFILQNANVDYLDLLLDAKQNLKVVPAYIYKDIPVEHLALWCHNKGIYGLPTTELIDWLKDQIIPSSIEIGSGNGAIGRELSIPITDACLMENPAIALAYISSGQPITKYPEDIIRRDAVSAIKEYNPNTVIGCWVTHKYDPREHWRGGNMFGIDEQFILDNVKKYIVIGNINVHKEKKILEKPHKEYQFPWLYSRSMSQDKNIIYVWEN